MRATRCQVRVEMSSFVPTTALPTTSVNFARRVGQGHLRGWSKWPGRSRATSTCSGRLVVARTYIGPRSSTPSSSTWSWATVESQSVVLARCQRVVRFRPAALDWYKARSARRRTSSEAMASLPSKPDAPRLTVTSGGVCLSCAMWRRSTCRRKRSHAVRRPCSGVSGRSSTISSPP